MLIEFTPEEKMVLRRYLDFLELDDVIEDRNGKYSRAIESSPLPDYLKKKTLRTIELYRKYQNNPSWKGYPEEFLNLYGRDRWAGLPLNEETVFEAISIGIVGEYFTMDKKSYYIFDPTQEEIKSLVKSGVVVIQPLERKYSELVRLGKQNSENGFIRILDDYIYSPTIREDLSFEYERHSRDGRIKLIVTGDFDFWNRDVRLKIRDILVVKDGKKYKVKHLVGSVISKDSYTDLFVQVEYLACVSCVEKLDKLLSYLGFRLEGEELKYTLSLDEIAEVSVEVALIDNGILIPNVKIKSKDHSIVENIEKINKKRLLFVDDFLSVIPILEELYNEIRRRGIITRKEEQVIEELSVLKYILDPPLGDKHRSENPIRLVEIRHENTIIDFASSLEALKKKIKHLYTPLYHEPADVNELIEWYNVIPGIDKMFLRFLHSISIKNGRVYVLGQDIDSLEKKYKKYIRKKVNYPLLDIGLQEYVGYFPRSQIGIIPKLLHVLSVDETLVLARRGFVDVDDINLNPHLLPLYDLVKNLELMWYKLDHDYLQPQNLRIEKYIRRYLLNYTCDEGRGLFCTYLAKFVEGFNNPEEKIIYYPNHSPKRKMVCTVKRIENGKYLVEVETDTGTKLMKARVGKLKKTLDSLSLVSRRNKESV